jgi:hypothetical protein
VATAKTCRNHGGAREQLLEQDFLRLGDRICGQAKNPGPMLWFLKIFSPKNSAKKLAFLTQNKAMQNFDHNIGF